MKKSLLLLPLFLVACGTAQQGAGDNPLVKERYWSELTDRLTSLQIKNDPILKDPAKAELVENLKQDALRRFNDWDTTVRKGISGMFLSANELTEGQALLLDGTLYLGSEFAAYPGPSLHIYLSEVLDPRGKDFSIHTALDLGTLRTPYGDQSYVLPESQKTKKFRTVILWDTKLGRLYAFAQLA